MNMNELSSQSEKYKREMMKLYSRRTPMEQYSQSSTVEKYTQPSAQEKAPKTEDFREITGNKAETPKPPSEEIIEETNNLQNPISESIEEVNPNAPDDTAWAPYSEKENDKDSSDEEKFNARYPDPDISVLEGATDTAYTPPIYDSWEIDRIHKGECAHRLWFLCDRGSFCHDHRYCGRQANDYCGRSYRQQRMYSEICSPRPRTQPFASPRLKSPSIQYLRCERLGGRILQRKKCRCSRIFGNYLGSEF